MTVVVTPEVGMGVTYCCGSDRYPFTIIEVVSDKKIVVQRDNYKRIDNNGYGGQQEYEYQQDSEGVTKIITLRKNGRWIAQGDPLSAHGYLIGERRAYLDPSF
jgi:hypothetical protein